MVEQATITRFVKYLASLTGLGWHASDDEVPTYKNNRNYDCEFTCSGEIVPIAADVCSLFPLGSDQEGQGRRAKFNARLFSELERQGLGGLLIEPRPVQKKHARPDWPKDAVSKIRAALENHTSGPFSIEGFSVQRIGTESDPSFFSRFSFTAYQPPEAAGYALVALLKKKHDQLDVEGISAT
jgi:hypothetical protein